MNKKILIVIVALIVLLPIGYSTYVSYENNKYEKNLNKEAGSILNDEQKTAYKELYTVKDKKEFLKMAEDVKDRNKSEYDDDYLVKDTENVDINNIEDGVYLTYDSSDEKSAKVIKEYYKKEDRPRLIIMNKGIEQGYIQFYNVYKKVANLKTLNSTDFPNGFYVRDGKVVKEYGEDISISKLPDNSLDKALQEAKDGEK